MLSTRLLAIPENLYPLIAFAQESALELGYPQADYKTELVCEEAITNVIKYAYATDRPGDVEVRCYRDGRYLQIEIVDWGIPFNPLNMAKPDLSVPLEERPIGGLGIYLIRENTDRLAYRYEQESNILTVSFVIPTT